MGYRKSWKNVQGIWKPNGTREGQITLKPHILVDFHGKGKYSEPEFTWRSTVGPSAIVFANTDKLGKQYENDIFVGDVNNGRLYHFDLNNDRTFLYLNGSLADKIADTQKELQDKIFVKLPGGITDIDVGPDGYLYIVSLITEVDTTERHEGQGTIFRIVPIDNIKDGNK